MGTNACCKRSDLEKNDVQYEINKDSLSEYVGTAKNQKKSINISKPPLFHINSSLNKGKVSKTPKQRRPITNSTEIILGKVRRGKLISEPTRISKFPINMKEKSLTITKKVKRKSNLNVNPRCFRIEKSGKVEDNYEILEVIGKGGYGEVRKIKDLRTNEIKAVKAIARNKCQTASPLSDEISILQELVYRV